MISLGLTPAEVGDLTPRQIAALWLAWREHERTHDRRAALMPWLYAESKRDREKQQRAFTLEDFMPSDEPQRVQSPKELVDNQMLAMEQWRIYYEVMAEQKKSA